MSDAAPDRIGPFALAACVQPHALHQSEEV